ncbi:HB21 protein, partial [Thinocorus orbignyianus]|nr:HB21 protein [Thinocorus orbignyianus]
AMLVALVVLGTQGAGGEQTSGFFQYQFKAYCYFSNGTERVRLVDRYIYNREQDVHFDSDVGYFVGDTPQGEVQAKYFNSQPDILEQKRADVDRFCRHNHQVYYPFTVAR